MLDWEKIAAGLGWLVAALLAFMGRDALKRIRHLEQTTVSKTDLDDLEGRLSQQNHQMHGENSKRLDNIESGIRQTHGRIDDLYRDLINGRD